MMRDNHINSNQKIGGARNSDARTATLALTIFLGLASIYLIAVNVIGKIGLAEYGALVMVVALPLAVFIFAGLVTRTSGSGEIGGLGQFQQAAGAFSPTQNAMAGGSEWMSILLVSGMVSAYSTTNHDGLAMTSGIFFGLALGALILNPKLDHNNFKSVAGLLAAHITGNKTTRTLLRLTMALTVILVAFLILISQIGAGAHILRIQFFMPVHWAAICLLAPVLLVLLFGGMRGVTLANMLLFGVIGAAVILPTIWLSLQITGNLLPQYNYGRDALQPILEIEGQLAAGVATSDGLAVIKGLQQNNFTNLVGSASFFSTFFVMMAGSAGLPLLFSRISASASKPERAFQLGWTLIFVAVVMAFIPPFVIFTKFEIFRNLVGLPINQLVQGTQWLFSWANVEQGNHALICGEPAISLDAIIAACGGGADYVILPSDINFSALMTFLSAGQIAKLPPVLSALSYAGILCAATTTMAIALMVIANTITSEIFMAPAFEIKQTVRASIATNLFTLRAAAIVTGAFAVWVAINIWHRDTNFILWGFAISAGAIFPVIMVSLMLRATTPIGALTGLLAGVFVTGYGLITIEYGADWVVQNGDEQLWLLPFSQLPAKAEHSAIYGFLAACVTIVVVSLVENWMVKYLNERGK